MILKELRRRKPVICSERVISSDVNSMFMTKLVKFRLLKERMEFNLL